MTKRISITILMLVFVTITYAQENKTIKEVSTVKRVVKKEGSNVIIKEVEEVAKTKGTVVVANNEEENQVFAEDTTKVDDTNVLVDDIKVDENNEALIIAEKIRQEEALEQSKADALAKAAAEKKLLEKKKLELEQQLIENRKKLERRGKGVTRLKKNRKKRRND